MSYRELVKQAGSKEILSDNYLKSILNGKFDLDTIELLFTYKILYPVLDKYENLSHLSVLEFIDNYKKFHLTTGIEFDEDVFKSNNAGLALTLGTINELYNRWFEQKIPQSQIQKGVNEIHTLPSKTNPHQIYYIMIPDDSKPFYKENKKKVT